MEIFLNADKVDSDTYIEQMNLEDFSHHMCLLYAVILLYFVYTFFYKKPVYKKF